MNNKYNKILILGNGGSGKTTLAKEISKMLSMPLLHLDKIYWKEGWNKYDKNVFLEKNTNFMQQEKWIIEGTPLLGLDDRIKAATVIIFLDIHKILCILRVLIRNFKHILNITRLNDGCPEKLFSLKIIKWIWLYEKNKRKLIYSALENHKKTPVFYVKNNYDLMLLIKEIKKFNQITYSE